MQDEPQRQIFDPIQETAGPLTDAERARRYRDRRRGGPPRQLQPCGTVAAYRRHLRAGEAPCDACRKANAERSARYS